MCKMKFVLLLCMVLYVTGLNEKQMKAAVKLARNMCQPKTKASNEDIEKMHSGDWNVDHSAMCYMFCALNMYKLMHKNNTFNYESAMTQLAQLPDSYRSFVKVCMDQCQDKAVTLNDKCAAAYELSKCMYFCNPEKYFLP
ncbi:unnamed protein product [Phyllotreta striolata]|uniref:Uncharacterized protein n=1 Tax=Phyllotreta striolata TaxID=444603 RepID=A0A9P0GYL1_PHYSR|nr:unnamed protein product [Phyllotreta striolata]